MTDTPHVPIHAGDPLEVFEEVARLLTRYRDRIERDLKNRSALGATIAEFEAYGAAYCAYIGSDIPDAFIQAAVRRLAYNKFRDGVAAWARQQDR